MCGRILPVRLLAWAGIGLCVAAAVAARPGRRSSRRPNCRRRSIRPTIRSSSAFVWRSIGPANMGGRIDDIAVDRNSPSTFYVGFATGGIWKTTNNGTTWTPIFDKHPVSSIGDIALAPSNPDIIYVGTGEPNNRQSSSFGGGVYKSTDGGKTFVHVGLKETQIDRPRRRPPEGSEHRLRRSGRTPVRTEPGARPLQDHGRRQDLDEHEVHRQRHRLHRRGDGSVEPRTCCSRRRISGGASRGASTAAARAADLEDDRTGEDLDEADRQRPAGQSDHRPHRPRHRALEALDDLRLDRSRAERRHRRRRQ